MDKELIAYLDERFRETSRQIQSLREETTRHFEQVDQRFEQIDQHFERVEESIRQTQVMVEGVRSDIRLVAEGAIGLDERLVTLRGEVTRGFEDVRGWIRCLPYADLASRIRQLEVWRETKERDPIEIVRERFGRKAPRP
jgi:chromosome segregation ATPase